jgi:hypothetical protein
MKIASNPIWQKYQCMTTGGLEIADGHSPTSCGPLVALIRHVLQVTILWLICKRAGKEAYNVKNRGN